MLPDEATPRPASEYATDRYGPIFLLLVATLGFTTFVDESQLSRALAGLFLVAAIVGTLRATGVTPLQLRITLLGGVGLAVAVIAGEASSRSGVEVVVTLFVAGALGFAGTTLLRRIFEQPTIRVKEVLAALSAYLEFTMVFAFAYMAVARATDGAFFTNGIEGQMGEFAYFSVVTITTLGYGDLAPATDIGRSLVMIETLFGQIFLVVLVAFLVGRLGQGRRQDAG